MAANSLAQNVDGMSVGDTKSSGRGVWNFAPVASGVQIQTPESAAAKGLFSAWQRDDRVSAAQFATKKAIDHRKDKYHFENCSKYSGATHCWYRNEDGGSLNLKMTKAGPAWKVESMEFVDVS